MFPLVVCRLFCCRPTRLLHSGLNFMSCSHRRQLLPFAGTSRSSKKNWMSFCFIRCFVLVICPGTIALLLLSGNGLVSADETIFGQRCQKLSFRRGSKVLKSWMSQDHSKTHLIARRYPGLSPVKQHLRRIGFVKPCLTTCVRYQDTW